jgi:hypothetical protein
VGTQAETRERFMLRGKAPKLVITRELRDEHLNVWDVAEEFGPFVSREAAREFMLNREGREAG